MYFRTSAMGALALSFALALPLQAQDDAPDADTVVATVGDTEITIGHMIVLRSRLPQQYQQLPDDVLFQGILDQIVQQVVVGQAAGDLSREHALAIENERRALLASQLIEEVAEGAVTDEALQAAYDEAYGNLEPETEFNAAHILVETEEEARALIEELDGGADFATLAREHSTGPSGPNGGSLGWFGKGMMVPPFEEAVIALEPGAFSQDPVQTQFGWHVLILNETRVKDAPTLDAVREELAAEVQGAAVDARVQELTDAAEITRADVSAIDPAILRDLSLVAE
ncbi:MAG: peptidylprolyl isomerase [Pseudomonadota bacterium]